MRIHAGTFPQLPPAEGRTNARPGVIWKLLFHYLDNTEVACIEPDSAEHHWVAREAAHRRFFWSGSALAPKSLLVQFCPLLILNSTPLALLDSESTILIPRHFWGVQPLSLA